MKKDISNREEFINKLKSQKLINKYGNSPVNYHHLINNSTSDSKIIVRGKILEDINDFLQHVRDFHINSIEK